MVTIMPPILTDLGHRCQHLQMRFKNRIFVKIKNIHIFQIVFCEYIRLFHTKDEKDGPLFSLSDKMFDKMLVDRRVIALPLIH